VDGLDARVPGISPARSLRAAVITFGALAWSGFRRYSTYRQATVAGAFTNTVFGFLRCYVLLAVAAAAPMWGAAELAERIRTGDIAADLLRPVSPVISYLAQDLGRAGHATLARFLPPLAVGALCFPLYVPDRWGTVPLFALSVVLAVVCSFAARYLVNATAYWLHDARGPVVFWTLSSGVLAGLYFPLRLLPDWATVTLWLATPMPSLLQTPLDVLVERDPPLLQTGLVAVQAIWAVLLLAACRAVQRRAERKLVVQGG
jgi:ABC-2 type transport system permease protein